MKDIQDALGRVGKSLAEIGQVIVDALEGMTPEQRAIIEFLAENPKVAEAFQELNQKLTKQKAVGTEKVQASKVPASGNCHKYRFEVVISDMFAEYANKDLVKARLLDLLEKEIDKQLEEE